jgi:hypothetical protein
VENSQKICFRRLLVWNNSGVVILRYHSIHKRSSTSISYETWTLRWYLLTGHCTVFEVWSC